MTDEKPNPALKFCKACKHGVTVYGSLQCGHAVNHTQSLVTGEWIYKYPADHLRGHGHLCGVTGQLWEPRLEAA